MIRVRLFAMIAWTLFVGTGCEKSVDWQLTPSHGERLVVESILTNELRIQEVRLSTTFDTLNGTPRLVDDAHVQVRAGLANYSFVPDPVSPGLYKSVVAFAVVGQLQYFLEVEWQGEVYTASNTMSEVAPIPPIHFEPADTLGNFTLGDNVIPVYNPGQQAMYQIDLNWAHLQPGGQNEARLFYFTFNTIHVSEFLRPARAEVIFPGGTIALITKYGLSDGFAEYLRSVTIETYWNGNWFYGNPENPAGNISNGGLGFFATCAVLREIVIVQ